MPTRPNVELDCASPSAIDGRQIRALTFADVRMRYLTRTLQALGMDSSDRTALVIGAGRGLLPEALAEMGFDVTAVDASTTAIELARSSSTRAGRSITYLATPAESLAGVEGSFDVIYCADTFEITSSLDAVVAQAADRLHPNGVLVYDTVNRTPVSRLVYLGLFQAVASTRIMPPGRYAAARLRTPVEMAEALQRHGLRNVETRGFKPASAASLVKAVLGLRKGTMTDIDVGQAVAFKLEGPPLVTYLGYACHRGFTTPPAVE